MPAAANRSSVESSRFQLLGVQYLRAVAALMVAYYHTVGQVPAYREYFETYFFGNLNLASGVDVFFVISGFIMLISNRNSTPAQFAIKRIIRVVPLYWFLTTLLAILALWRPGLFRTTVVTTTYYLKSLLFIPYLNPGHELFPLLVPGWSLNFEMFFYAIFALLLFAPARFRMPTLGLVLGALITFGWVAGIDPLSSELGFYTDTRILEFWLGMLIAQLLLSHSLKCPRYVAVVLLLCGFVALLTRFPADAMHLSDRMWDLFGKVLPAGLIVFGMVALEEQGVIKPHRLLHWLGDASYSIYLTHIFSLGLARFVWSRLGLERDGIIYAAGFAVFGIAFVIIGSWFVYTFVEKPLLNVLQRLTKRRFPTTVAAAGASLAVSPKLGSRPASSDDRS